jgi:hypothetical protein
MTDGFPPPTNGNDGSSIQGLPRIGTMFAGYGLEGVLGRGGMSVDARKAARLAPESSRS